MANEADLNPKTKIFYSHAPDIFLKKLLFSYSALILTILLLRQQGTFEQDNEPPNALPA